MKHTSPCCNDDADAVKSAIDPVCVMRVNPNTSGHLALRLRRAAVTNVTSDG